MATSRNTIMTIKELSKQAEVKESPNSYSVKTWATSAVSLFEKGDFAKLNGDLERAYVHYLKAISIVVDVIPKHRDFKQSQQSDMAYRAARTKVVSYMSTMESLKAELQKRFGESRSSSEISLPNVPTSLPSSRRPSSVESSSSSTSQQAPQLSVVHPERLLGLLKEGRLAVLIFDIRPMEEHIQGHIKWRMKKGGTAADGGVVHLEPDWLYSERVNSSDLAGYLTSFGQSTSLAKNLFDYRNKVDLVVYYDQSSSTAQSQTLKAALQILYTNEDRAKRPKIQPALLVGGFDAWERQIKKSGERLGDWIEIGEGCGRFMDSENGKPENGDDTLGIARSAYEYVANRDRGTGSNQFVQKPRQSPPPPSHGPVRSLPPDHTNKLTTPLNNSTNVSIGKLSTGAMPVIVPVTQSQHQYYQAPAPSQSRFNDPFYTFQRGGKGLPPAPIASYSNYSSSSSSAAYTNGVKPRSESLGYPNVGHNSSSHAPAPVSYPSSISPSSYTANNIPANNILTPQQRMNQATGPLRQRNDIMPSAPAGAYTPTYSQQPYTPNYQVQPTAPFPQPQQHSYSSPHGSPSQIRKPPPVAIAPPAVTIRRSSSPSGSPSTARFYGVPPMPPPKSRAHSSSSDNLTAAGMQLTTSTLGNGPSTDFLSASQFGSSFMGMAGLKNLGNSCFMNSVIQCVGGTVPLARYFLDGSYRKHINRKNPLGTRGEVADSFAELVKTMWSGQEAVITPKKFKEIIGTHHPSFRGNEQQDSQEFLAFLLDSLHEDLNVARVGTIPPDKESDEDEENIPDEILLEKAWAKYRSRNWSIIVDLFQGILRNRLQCLTCGKTSTTFNPVMYFTLPIPERNQVGKKGGAVYLQECLDKYVEEEIMEGDNAWKCPRCKVLRRSTKQLTIARLPVILLVHLKRFYYQGPFRNRIDTYVEFPLGSLDLTRFVTQQRSNTHAASQEPFVYDLYGVSNHFGGLNGGHYTAQVKNGYKNNAWFNFDDSRISPADENSIKSPAAYILLYVRNMSGRRTQQDWWSGNARM